MEEKRLNPREKALLEEKKKNNKMRNRYILVGVLVVLFILLVVYVNFFLAQSTALRVGDVKCSLADANYEYNNTYMQLAQTYAQYGLLDTSTPLDEQTCLFDADGGTWHDYLLDNTEEQLKQRAVLYKAAQAAGYTQLTEDEQAEIDSAMLSYTYYGSTYGLSLDGYLLSIFGAGNDEKHVREIMTREYLSSRYLNDVYQSYSYTDAEKDAYYAEHADDLNTVEFLYVFISGAADESAGLDQEAAMSAAAETARTIVSNSAGDEDLFRAAVSAALEQEPTETSYSVSSFLSSYEGDVTREELTAGTVFAHEDSSGWYAVYVLGLEDNDYRPVSVRHILVKAVDEDGDGVYSEEEKQAAYDAILAIQEEWLAGEATEDSFAALANLKSEDGGSNTTGGLYEGIVKGKMVKGFEKFCFAGHESGDYGIVYGEGDSYAGYHLIYFVGVDEDGELQTRALADSAMRGDDYNAFATALTENVTAERTFIWKYVGRDKTK